jgi:cytochrome c553
MTWLVSGSYWLRVTNELLLPYCVKKNVTKGQRQRLKPEKDTKVSTCQVVHRKSVRGLTSASQARIVEEDECDRLRSLANFQQF